MWPCCYGWWRDEFLGNFNSENDEDLLKPLAWLGEEVAISGDMMLFRHNQNVKYLAYYFQTGAFQKQKYKYITGAKVRRVSKDSLTKFKIPIPSLAEQARIVAILDKFDTLTHSISEGLPREIELRQKQYEYYRDLLLSFPPPRQATPATPPPNGRHSPPLEGCPKGGVVRTVRGGTNSTNSTE